MHIEIEYDVFGDQWLVKFHEGNKVAERRYGSLSTVLGAIEDYAKDYLKTLKKSENPH